MIVRVGKGTRVINPAHIVSLEIFENTKNTIVIDHHKTNPGFGKINYIKGGISSTGEVLFDLEIRNQLISKD